MPPRPPFPPPPSMPRAALGGHRPPPGFCRPAEGGRSRPFKRPYSPFGRGRRHGERNDCDQQRRQVRHLSDWDGPGFDGGFPGPVRAHPRGGGNNDGGRPSSPPPLPFGAPPCPTRGPPFAPTTVVEALGACRLVALPARRAFRSIHLLAVAGTASAALHACRGPCRRALIQAHPDVRHISGAALMTTARAIRQDSRGAHRLTRQRPNAARQGPATGTGRGTCRATPRALLPAGGGRPPTRRGATTNPWSGSVHHRRLCGPRLTRARPGGSTSAEVRQARRTSSGC